MRILEVLFLLSTTFSIIHADLSGCPGSTCGSLYINYPFKQQNTQSQDNCTYIDVKCDMLLNNGTAIVSLPYAGEFYIREIVYNGPYVKLVDPEDCLMGRFMKNLNLSSSPFKAITYENYTFYTCPTPTLEGLLEDDLWPIDCLSTSTSFTVATATTPTRYNLGDHCQIIGSWMLPVQSKGQFEFMGAYDDLYLTWNHTTCTACEHLQSGPEGDTGDGDAGKGGSDSWLHFLLTGVVLLLIFVSWNIRCRVQRSTSNDGVVVSETAPPQAATRGVDACNVNSCTELVILSDSIMSPVSGSHTCSICLESYQPQEIVRSIAKCGHCFHAECIQEWFIESKTCPVCRATIIVSDITS